ncbi:hypothetical protein PPUTLS46_008514 [Pseudomonas putida LS46]|nr:hypothetical protein PPUTLS46_008514 [Pseudomonas putida LS46]
MGWIHQVLVVLAEFDDQVPNFLWVDRHTAAFSDLQCFEAIHCFDKLALTLNLGFWASIRKEEIQQAEQKIHSLPTSLLTE